MIAEVKKSNHRLEDVHAGTVAAFALENPRKLLFSSSQRELVSLFLLDTTSEYIVTDTSKGAEYFGGCAMRLKIGERELAADDRNQRNYDVGTCYAGDNSRFGDVSADVYLWKKLRGKDLNDYYELTGSRDNRNFFPVPVAFELVREQEFDHYVMRNAAPIPGEIRYLRLTLKAPEPKQSWANQIANIKIER